MHSPRTIQYVTELEEWLANEQRATVMTRGAAAAKICDEFSDNKNKIASKKEKYNTYETYIVKKKHKKKT